MTDFLLKKLLINMTSFKKVLTMGLLGYSSTSLLLLFSPTLLHKKKDARDSINKRGDGTLQIVNCAHRCGSYEGFENTVPAAINAIKNGSS